MTAHELAKKLLEMEDIEVGFAYNVLGWVPVEKVYKAKYCNNNDDVKIIVLDGED